MQVQTTTRKTYRQAVKVLARAFLGEPVTGAVYRGLTTTQKEKNLTADFTGELAVCLRRGEPLEVLVNGAVRAAAVIYPPGALPLPRLDQWYIWWSSIWGHARYDLRKWAYWLEETEKLRPKHPHYYLEYMGVEPAFQGRGLGSFLLEDLTRRADQAGAGSYLETATPRNMSLYQRFGFQAIAEKKIIGVLTWFMWRPPVRSDPQHCVRSDETEIRLI
jgi:GNAT superfamily N-acetyltransferase